MGPEGFQEDSIYLRTAVSVEKSGWAHFDYVKMPDYRWGIFLNPTACCVVDVLLVSNRAFWRHVFLTWHVSRMACHH